MPEQKEVFIPASATAEIASAPGDLPIAQVDMRNMLRRRQFRHDNTTNPLAPVPNKSVEVWATTGEELHLEEAAVFYTTDGRLPDSAATRQPMRIAGVEWEPRVGYLTRWSAVIPPQAEGTTVRYRIGGWRSARGNNPPDLWAHDGQGFWFRFADETGNRTFAYHVEPEGQGTPAWIADAVIYHIFLDRFHPGTADGHFVAGRGPTEIHGGTLQGVRQALPYLEALGVTCLWLSPIFAAESYHRYDTLDYYTVDPHLGTNQDMRDLSDEAHARGMRIMLDFVPSHVSWHHPAFLAAQDDRDAETASWFIFDKHPGEYRNFLGLAPTLPSTNTNDPAAREHIIGGAVHALHTFGVDAFRLDHAIGPGMDFWVAFRNATHAVARDVFSVGEVTDTPDSLRRYRHRLDAVLDFPLAGALRLTFGRGDWSVERFDTFLRSYEYFMQSGPGRVSFLDNHDMNRFLFVAGKRVERLQLAALCQFTLESPPTIYYGTEIGMPQEASIEASGFAGDAEVRRDMLWDERFWNQNLLAFYRALIRLRREQPALRYGKRQTVHCDAPTKTYAYVRTLSQAAHVADTIHDVITLFNLDEQAHTIALAISGVQNSYSHLLSTGAEPRIQPEAHTLSVTLGAQTGCVLAIGPNRR